MLIFHLESYFSSYGTRTWNMCLQRLGKHLLLPKVPSEDAIKTITNIEHVILWLLKTLENTTVVPSFLSNQIFIIFFFLLANYHKWKIANNLDTDDKSARGISIKSAKKNCLHEMMNGILAKEPRKPKKSLKKNWNKQMSHIIIL